MRSTRLTPSANVALRTTSVKPSFLISRTFLPSDSFVSTEGGQELYLLLPTDIHGGITVTKPEYDETTGKVSKEVIYDDRDKPVRIRKYEYNEDGTKKKQYNYLPNGKLYSVKVFEYLFSD